MPRLGKKNSDAPDENGRLYFGNKDSEYLKNLSRDAVEEHHNSPILYFEVDWEKSLKNFYGEMLKKKFKDAKGIQIRGSYTIKQEELNVEYGIQSKLLILTVSVYDEQLKELNIKPQKGDYFSIGKRLYQIYDLTTDDVGVGNLMMNREKMRTDYLTYQDSDELLMKDVWGDRQGTEFSINNGSII